jgi:hypothetical protein
VKKNSFRFDNEVLFIQTECGEYKFKIDSDTSLTKAEKIAELMVREMDKVENKFQRIKKKTSPYAKLLLANLNMADKYIQIERKYSQLTKEREKMLAETLGAKSPVLPQTMAAKERRQPPAVPLHGISSNLPSSRVDRSLSDSVALGKAEQTTVPVESSAVKDFSPPATSAVSVRPSTASANVSSDPVIIKTGERTSGPIESSPAKDTSPPTMPPVPIQLSTVSPNTPVAPVVLRRPDRKINSIETPQRQESTKPAASTLPLATASQASTESMILKTVERIGDSLKTIHFHDSSQTRSDSSHKPALEDLGGIKKLLPLPDIVPVPTDANRGAAAENQIAEASQPLPQSTSASTIQRSPLPPLKLNAQNPAVSFDRQADTGFGEDFELPYLDFLRTADQTVVLDHDAIRRDAEIRSPRTKYRNNWQEIR